MGDDYQAMLGRSMRAFVERCKADHEARNGVKLTLEEYVRRFMSGETYLPKAPPGADSNTPKDITS